MRCSSVSGTLKFYLMNRHVFTDNMSMRDIRAECLCGAARGTSRSRGDERASPAAGIHDTLSVEGAVHESLSHQYR